nr:sulfite exporter TauE/SafE family protein [Clostridia bacterium]
MNGLLGAGGGVLLYFALGVLCGNDTKENLIATSVSVMFFSIVSLFFYSGNNTLDISKITTVCLPAAAGGICGALLLKRLPQTVVKRIFSLVLVIGGILMLTKG